MKFPKTVYIGNKQWVFVEKYEIYVRFKGILYLFTIMPGFIYDKVSTFRLATFITGVDRSGPGDIWSAHHDAGYVMKGEMTKGSNIMTCSIWEGSKGFVPFHGTFTRKEVDDMMKVIMEDTNRHYPDELTPAQIRIHHWAVRLGGWTKWMRKKRPENDYLYDLTKLKM
jgi:hypothetical protein